MVVSGGGGAVVVPVVSGGGTFVAGSTHCACTQMRSPLQSVSFAHAPAAGNGDAPVSAGGGAVCARATPETRSTEGARRRPKQRMERRGA